ncbi:Hypothetical predicted protein [Xyrichtys novacula]|uniref:Uncharacterized protein n=1 Tax=Xyrichtys novacula TaxID=13765 RepID=A0AAV1HNN8_XYRNO|nr:Hypothetical predicted protein [Xyrichtys novacula]
MPPGDRLMGGGGTLTRGSCERHQRLSVPECSGGNPERHVTTGRELHSAGMNKLETNRGSWTVTATRTARFRRANVAVIGDAPIIGQLEFAAKRLLSDKPWKYIDSYHKIE